MGGEACLSGKKDARFKINQGLEEVQENKGQKKMYGPYLFINRDLAAEEGSQVSHKGKFIMVSHCAPGVTHVVYLEEKKYLQLTRACLRRRKIK